MSGGNTCLAVIWLTLLSGLPAVAWPLTATQRAETFAICTGSYMAELEHAWLVDTTRADALDARRAAFASLLDAVAPDAAALGLAPARLTALRAHARLAHRDLLGRATFHAEPSIRRAALGAVEARRSRCAALLLGA